MTGVGVIGVPIADAGHLAAAEHGAVDARAAFDCNLGVGYTACPNIVIFLGVALAAAEDVAHALVAAFQQLLAVGIADAGGGAADGDGDHAVVFGIVHMATRFSEERIAVNIHASEGQAATTEDGALDGTAVHGDADVARHATVGMVGVEEVATAAEDVAVPSGEAVIADVGTFVDIDFGVAKHVGIGAAAKDGTPNLATADGDFGIVDVGKCLAQLIRVFREALAAAKHVSVQARVVERADGAAANDDLGIAFDRAVAAATVDVAPNGTARDFHIGIAIDATSDRIDQVD